MELDIKAKFIVKAYSINVEYLDLDVDDFSGLIPQWNVGNPIE